MLGLVAAVGSLPSFTSFACSALDVYLDAIFFLFIVAITCRSFIYLLFAVWISQVGHLSLYDPVRVRVLRFLTIEEALVLNLLLVLHFVRQ